MFMVCSGVERWQKQQELSTEQQNPTHTHKHTKVRTYTHKARLVAHVGLVVIMSAIVTVVVVCVGVEN